MGLSKFPDFQTCHDALNIFFLDSNHDLLMRFQWLVIYRRNGKLETEIEGFNCTEQTRKDILFRNSIKMRQNFNIVR